MAFHPLSKADSVFLGDQVYGDLFEDQSQFDTNLTDNSDWLESSDDRFAITAPREISLRVYIDSSSDAGVLVYYGDDDSTLFCYKIDVDTGIASFYHNSNASPIAQITLTGLAAMGGYYVIHWSTTRDYVGGSYLSEFAVYEENTSSWFIKRATHSIPIVNLAHKFTIGGLPDGESKTQWTGGISSIDKVRIGRRFHSTTECKEDYVSISSDPDDPDGEYLEPEHCPHLRSPFVEANMEPVATAIANDYSFEGPTLWLSRNQGWRNRNKLISPLINQGTSPTPVVLSNTLVPSTRFVTAPDDVYTLSVNYMWVRPIPRGCISANVKVFAQTYLALGAPGGSSVSIGLKMFSLDKYLIYNVGDYYTSSSIISTTNHTSTGIGEWFDLGEIPLIITNLSTGNITFLALGYWINPGVTGYGYNRLKIKHVVVEPIPQQII